MSRDKSTTKVVNDYYMINIEAEICNIAVRAQKDPSILKSAEIRNKGEIFVKLLNDMSGGHINDLRSCAYAIADGRMPLERHIENGITPGCRKLFEPHFAVSTIKEHESLKGFQWGELEKIKSIMVGPRYQPDTLIEVWLRTMELYLSMYNSLMESGSEGDVKHHINCMLIGINYLTVWVSKALRLLVIDELMDEISGIHVCAKRFMKKPIITKYIAMEAVDRHCENDRVAYSKTKFRHILLNYYEDRKQRPMLAFMDEIFRNIATLSSMSCDIVRWQAQCETMVTAKVREPFVADLIMSFLLGRPYTVFSGAKSDTFKAKKKGPSAPLACTDSHALLSSGLHNIVNSKK